MTFRHTVPVAVFSHPGSPRIGWANTDAGTWSMCAPDPSDVAGIELLVRSFSGGVDLMRAMLFGTVFFDPTNPLDVEDADEQLRAHLVEVVHLPVEVDADGDLTDPGAVLAYVQSEHGQQMRAERAVQELVSRPSGGGSGEQVSAPSHGSHLQTIDSFDPGDRQYWPRDLFGSTDIEVLQTLRRTSHGHVRLYGPPGAGKTSLVAAAFGGDVITIQGHPDLTAATLCGQYLPGPDGHWQWVDGPLTRAMREGKVLLFDEISRAPKDVDDVLLPTVDQRRELILSDRPDLAPITAEAGFMVVATYNNNDYGTRPLSGALLRRLNVHIHVDTDYEVARSRGIDARLLVVAANLRTSAQDFARRHSGDPSWYPQMADLEGAHTMLDLFGEQAAFTALGASCEDRGRLEVAAAQFTAVFGVPVRSVTALGG